MKKIVQVIFNEEAMIWIGQTIVSCAIVAFILFSAYLAFIR